MKTSNSELITPREIRRDFNGALDRLVEGQVEKLVLIRSNQFVAVVLNVEQYEKLLGGDESPDEGTPFGHPEIDEVPSRG
jgi:hypothetical protein